MAVKRLVDLPFHPSGYTELEEIHMRSLVFLTLREELIKSLTIWDNNTINQSHRK
jgi:hypothetical protein